MVSQADYSANSQEYEEFYLALAISEVSLYLRAVQVLVSPALGLSATG
jgi:hypothetical protein